MTVSGPAIGAMVVASFAVLWAGLGGRSLGRPWAIGLTLVSSLLSLAIILVAIQRLHAPPPRTTAVVASATHPGAYWLSVGFEAVAIPIALFILKRTGRDRYILPTIAFLVGLHFFGLVPAFGAIEFAWVAGAMCALPVIVVVLLPPAVSWHIGGAARQVDLWALVVGLGCAAILWCSAVSLLLEV